MSEQLIQSFDMNLATPECFPGVDWYCAGVHYAELKSADYDHGAKILLWMSDNKKYAFRPCEIVVAPVENREEAQRLVNKMK